MEIRCNAGRPLLFAPGAKPGPEAVARRQPAPVIPLEPAADEPRRFLLALQVALRGHAQVEPLLAAEI